MEQIMINIIVVVRQDEITIDAEALVVIDEVRVDLKQLETTMIVTDLLNNEVNQDHLDHTNIKTPKDIIVINLDLDLNHHLAILVQNRPGITHHQRIR